MDGLHPTLDQLDGAKPVKLLSFLETMRDEFGTMGASEAAKVRVLAYVLGGDARDVHQEQLEMVYFDYSGKSPDSSDHGSWRQVVNALLRRCLNDDMLREAHDGAARETQSDREDGSKLAKRLSRVARLCRNVFTNDKFVNFYVQELRTAVREIVSQQVRQLPAQYRGSIPAVR